MADARVVRIQSEFGFDAEQVTHKEADVLRRILLKGLPAPNSLHRQ
jgi:hypothetical protein